MLIEQGSAILKTGRVNGSIESDGKSHPPAGLRLARILYAIKHGYPFQQYRTIRLTSDLYAGVFDVLWSQTWPILADKYYRGIGAHNVSTNMLKHHPAPRAQGRFSEERWEAADIALASLSKVEGNVMVAMLEMNVDDIPVKLNATRTVLNCALEGALILAQRVLAGEAGHWPEVVDYFDKHAPMIAVLLREMEVAIGGKQELEEPFFDVDVRRAVENCASGLYRIAKEESAAAEAALAQQRADDGRRPKLRSASNLPSVLTRYVVLGLLLSSRHGPAPLRALLSIRQPEIPVLTVGLAIEHALVGPHERERLNARLRGAVPELGGYFDKIKDATSEYPWTTDVLAMGTLMRELKELDKQAMDSLEDLCKEPEQSVEERGDTAVRDRVRLPIIRSLASLTSEDAAAARTAAQAIVHDSKTVVLVLADEVFSNETHGSLDVVEQLECYWPTLQHVTNKLRELVPTSRSNTKEWLDVISEDLIQIVRSK
jgi:hypothetical protein